MKTTSEDGAVVTRGRRSAVAAITATVTLAAALASICVSGCTLALDFDVPPEPDVPTRERFVVIDDRPDVRAFIDTTVVHSGDNDDVVEVDVPVLCGNGIVEHGEICDSTDALTCREDCTPVPGVVCDGSWDPICLPVRNPQLVVGSNETVYFNQHVSGDRTYPDAVSYPVQGGAAGVLLAASKPLGIEPGDEVVVLNIYGTERERAGGYVFARVTEIEDSKIHTNADPAQLNPVFDGSQLVLVQRVPHYSSVKIFGTLVVDPLTGLRSTEAAPTTGAIVLRSANDITITGEIEVSGSGHLGGTTDVAGPTYWGSVMISNADTGLVGVIDGPGGDGAGAFATGGAGGEGASCGCDGIAGGGGGGAGGGAGARCDLPASCGCMPCSPDPYIAGAGGGVPPQIGDRSQVIVTRSDLRRVGAGAGASQGGGGGGAGGPSQSANADLECVPAQGGDAFGRAGSAALCNGAPVSEAKEAGDGSDGGRGGGIVWLSAASISLTDGDLTGAIRANGLAGGDGGIGADGLSGGGGGMGGNGAAGGSVVLDANTLRIPNGAIQAAGGNGGNGGNGGGGDNAVGGLGATALDPSTPGIPGETGGGGSGAGGELGHEGVVILQFTELNDTPFDLATVALGQGEFFGLERGVPQEPPPEDAMD